MLCYATLCYAQAECVPSDPADGLESTRYGMLLNELVHTGPRLLGSVETLLRLALTFDSYSMADSMADVILYIARLAVRVEAASGMLLAPVGVHRPDSPHLSLASAEDLVRQLQALRTLMWGTLPGVCYEWIRNSHRRDEDLAGGDSKKLSPAMLAKTLDVHAHLVYVHANAHAQCRSADTVKLILTSFAYCTTNLGDRNADLGVPMPLLFRVMHGLRSTLLDWFDSGLRRADELNAVLSAVYATVTGNDTRRLEWSRFWSGVGRYVARAPMEKEEAEGAEGEQNDEPPLLKPQRSRSQGLGVVAAKGKEPQRGVGPVIAEFNLQIMELVGADAVMKYLPDSVWQHAEIQAALGKTKLAAEEVSKYEHVTCSLITGRDTMVYAWDADAILTQVTQLNKLVADAKEQKKKFTRERGERERAKKRQAFLRTLAIGGADEDQEAEEEEEEKRKLQEEERAQEDAKRAEDDLAAIVKPVVRDADVFTRKVDYIA